ncbi:MULTISPECIES: hypothetical protein [unclassified Methylobacterium]|uniref:hypothetical protein n=1 Tax=unclassified Methylobacterium TaxID=2615210 RepID=UPI0006F6D6EF|nr:MULTISPECIES: hypothetical protein [unclassified Methylobacterium]KQO61578.1 hypothetical protein ASF22_22165 [Methylobacterium sp. Leaf87]KQP62800.1 hypothetical protein ASF52_21215 [Methylobacterium sp. Leaf112]
MTAAQIAEMASMSQAEVIALAYEEAAGGDVDQALRDAAEDLLALEDRLATTERLVSRGFVRAGTRTERA